MPVARASVSAKSTFAGSKAKTQKIGTSTQNVSCSGNDSVELGVYMTYIKDQLDNENSCLELPKTIILLVSFSMLALGHLEQHKVFAVEHALSFDIEENANFAWSHYFGHKVVHDINSVADFWSWTRIGFLPLLVQNTWGYSEAMQEGYNSVSVNASSSFSTGQLPLRWDSYQALGQGTLPVRGDLLHYNRIIGGFRFRQERASIGYEYCRMPSVAPEDLWKSWLGKPCMPADPKYELSPQVDDAEGFGEPARIEWLMSQRDSLHALQQKTVDMEDGCAQLNQKGLISCLCPTCLNADGVGTPWLDEQTQRVEIAFVSYNADYGLISLVTVSFFMNRGGMIHKFVHVQSTFANFLRGEIWEWAMLLLCDIVWISTLLRILFSEVHEIIGRIRSSKDPWYVSLREYMGFWNGVDWISIFCAFLVIAMTLALQIVQLGVNSAFEQLIDIDPSAVSDEDFQEEMTDFMTMVEDVCSHERNYRLSFILYPMVVMLRLFKSFDAQKRLAVVTQTLVVSFQDMVHFFIVFFSVYFCMAINSVLLFGQDLEEFATIDRAIMTCFRAMFGEWDLGKMQEIGIFQASLWLMIFVVIMVLLLLNMLLAILMEAYERVKSTSGGESLPAQISEMWRRRRQFKRGERVRLNDIWDAYFDEIKDEKELLTSTREITSTHVLEEVPNIKASQAKRTLQNAQKRIEQDEDAYTTDALKQHIKQLDRRTSLISKDVKKLRREFNHFPDTIEPSSPGSAPLGVGSDPRFHNSTGPSTSPELSVMNTVRVVMGDLAGQISSVLDEEGQLFEKRQQELESQQKELIVCVKDSLRTMQSLRRRTDDMLRSLQQQRMRRRAVAQTAWQDGRPAADFIARPALTSGPGPGLLT